MADMVLNLSSGTIKEIVQSGNLTAPATMQIIGKQCRVSSAGKRVVELSLSDSEQHFDVIVGPSIMKNTKEVRLLIPFNVIDVTKLEKSEEGGGFLMTEYTNLRKCKERIGFVKEVRQPVSGTKRTAAKRKVSSETVAAPTLASHPRIISIKLIDDYNSRLGFAVKGKVTIVEKVRPVFVKDTYMDVLCFELFDGTGKIKINAWGTMAESVLKLVKVGKGYLIYGFTVKPVTPRMAVYNHTGHEFELTLTTSSGIVPDVASDDIELPVIQYTCIRNIVECANNSVINVKGIVIVVEEIERVVTEKKTLVLRYVTICDQTGFKIQLRLWDDLARQRLDVHQCYVFEYFVVNRNSGLLLTSGSSARINGTVDADLMNWFKDVAKRSPIISVQDVYDQRFSDESVTSFSVMLGPSGNSKTAIFKGVFRLMKFGPIGWFCKCDQCGRKLDVPKLPIKRVDCLGCKRVNSPLVFDYVSTLTFGDYIGHFECQVYTTVFRKICVKLGTDPLKNIEMMTETLEKMSFGFCKVEVKAVKVKLGETRLTVTDLSTFSWEFMRNHISSIVRADLDDSTNSAKLYHNYWTQTLGNAVLPVRISDLTGDQSEGFVYASKHRVYAFVGTLHSVSMDGDVNAYTFEKDECFITLTDALQQFSLDDEDVTKKFEVIFRKRTTDDEECVYVLLATNAITDAIYRDFEVARVMIYNHLEKFESAFDSYEEELPGEMPVLDVDMTLSPSMSTLSVEDEPLKKRSKK